MVINTTEWAVSPPRLSVHPRKHEYELSDWVLRTMQMQTEVTAHFTSEQLLLVAFADIVCSGKNWLDLMIGASVYWRFSRIALTWFMTTSYVQPYYRRFHEATLIVSVL